MKIHGIEHFETEVEIEEIFLKCVMSKTCLFVLHRINVSILNPMMIELTIKMKPYSILFYLKKLLATTKCFSASVASPKKMQPRYSNRTLFISG